MANEEVRKKKQTFFFLERVYSGNFFLQEKKFYGYAFLYLDNGIGKLEVKMDGLKPLFPNLPGQPRYYEGFLKAAYPVNGLPSIVSIGIFNASKRGRGYIYYEFDPWDLGLSERPVSHFDTLIIAAELEYNPQALDFALKSFPGVVATGRFDGTILLKDDKIETPTADKKWESPVQIVASAVKEGKKGCVQQGKKTVWGRSCIFYFDDEDSVTSSFKENKRGVKIKYTVNH